MKKNCPKPKDKKLVLANLNVVNAREATCNDLIQGKISIKGVPAILLFDSGCKHSFISYSMVRKLKLKPRVLEPS